MAQDKTIKKPELKRAASEISGFMSVRGQPHSGSVSKESEDYQYVSSKDLSSVMRRWDIETPIDDTLYESRCESSPITDMCTICASKGMVEKATHICRDCSQYGRYFCQSCWDYHNKFLPTHDTLSLSVSRDSNPGASVKSLTSASNSDDDIKMWLNELKQQIEKDKYNARAFEKKPNGNVESENISVILKDICKIIQKKSISQRDLLSKVETLYSKLHKACDDLPANSSETSTPLSVQGAVARKQESLEERQLSTAIVNAENETKDKRVEEQKQTQKALRKEEQHWKSKFSDVMYRLNKLLKQVSNSKYNEESFPMSKTTAGSHDEVNKCNNIILECCRRLKNENDCKTRTNKEVKCLLKEINDWNDVETINEAKQGCQDKIVKEFREGRLQLHKWKNDFKSAKQEVECLTKELKSWVDVKAREGEIDSYCELAKAIRSNRSTILEKKKELQSIETEVNSLLEEINAWDDTKPLKEAKGNACKVVEALRDCRLKFRDRKLDFKSGRNKASVARKEKQSQDQVIKEMWTMIRPTSGKVKSGVDETGKALTEIKKYVSDAQRLPAEFNELSKDCGARLVDNNPNIADLSNPYRPTKIAEQFSELYDNHWKDAFQTLKNKDQENTAYLLKIIVDCFEICWKISKNHQRNLKSAVCCPAENIASGQASKQKKGKTENPVSFSAVQSKTLSELRKQTADISVDGVISQIESAKKEWFVSKALGSYTTRCIELCWLMHVQTPPVVIDTCAKSGSNFDTSRYKQYTKAGKKIDFVVWPVLLLEDGGAVLCKGVAQGK